MSRSNGFILPLMLILLFILSLLLVSLYQAENAHLSLYSAVKEAAKTQTPLQNLADIEAQIGTANQMAEGLYPNPSNIPKENEPYLRAIDKETGMRIWQEKLGSFMVYIQCNKTNLCQVFRLHQLV